MDAADVFKVKKKRKMQNGKNSSAFEVSFPDLWFLLFFSGCLGNKIQIAEEIGGNLTWYPPDDASEVTASWVFSAGGYELLYLPMAIGLVVWGFGVVFFLHIPIHIPSSCFCLLRCFILFGDGHQSFSGFYMTMIRIPVRQWDEHPLFLAIYCVQ